MTASKKAKLTASNGDILFIPSHVLEEILLKLDAQSLFQCAFVCRYWNVLLTSPNFVSRSLNRTFDFGNQILLIKVCHHKKSLVTQVTYSLHWDNDQFDLFRTMETPSTDDFIDTRLIGVSNGLVCLVNRLSFKFILWNPTVRKYTCLPPTMAWDERLSNVGFGFDSSSNDFKIVHLVHRDINQIDTQIDSAWVFSYVTWSWKCLVGDIPPCFIHFGGPYVFFHVCFDDMLYWIAGHSKENYHFILTFDLTHEVFGQMLLPETLGTDPDSVCSLKTTGDSLLLIQEKYMYDDETDEATRCIYSLWIMKQFRDHKSWTNIFSMATKIIPYHILGIRKNDDIIIRMGGGQIWKYNATIPTNMLVRAMENSVSFCYHRESLYLLEKGEDVNSY